jgi:glycosyltransferase involved in cell wall biosynthesis
MKILYDHQTFTEQRYGGISRYFCELMDRFSRDPDLSCTLALRYSWNENLKNRPSLDSCWSRRSEFLSGPLFPFHQQICHVDILNRLDINKRESERLLKGQDFDLFHPTYYDPYFQKYLGNKPFILTVYDMIHELYPEYFSPQDPIRLWKKQLIETADSVIAISHSTRNDILQLTNVDPDKVFVTHLGNPFEYFMESLKCNVPIAGILPSTPYLLFVGTRSGYKNFNFFIAAMAGILKREQDLIVLCAGGGPFSAAETKFIRNLGIDSKVHYVRAQETTLRQLYSGARAFVFPSLYEGFGLPVLEAFSCGCPVLLSNSSSLPEVAGDAAEYFEPGNAESLVMAVEKVLSGDTCRADLARSGYERLKFFSWEKTAVETKQIYDGLLN